LIRTTGVAGLLAVATVLLWWLVFPADWSVVPTGEANSLASPVRARHWAAAGAGLAILAGVAGYLRGVLVALVGVAVPAFVLFCVYSATAEVVGADLWAVGALFLAPPLVAGVVAAAALGALVRRRRLRAPTTTG
jgi:hypothetical protein